MELFELQETNSALWIGKKVPPVKFRDVMPEGALEQDFEDLIVRHPSLLNWSDVVSFESADLLIISRQPRTQTRKRADLFAVSTDGELVVIEIKRDAADERGRREAMEFQAIRYAAASRKMTAPGIIDMFAEYLKRLPKSGVGATNDAEASFRGQAVTMLCKHVADEDEELGEADLEERLDPRTRQKIYLVAAGYEPDVLSACAWLREHEIDIACFRLRPYRIGDQIVLERERLIPPPELDEFLVEMRPSRDSEVMRPLGGVVRRRSDKPRLIRWYDDPEGEYAVSSWKDVLVEGTTKALQLGLSVGTLPMKNSAKGSDLRRPRKLRDDLRIETNYNAETIIQFLEKMFADREKPKGWLQIVTGSGRIIDVPEG